MSEASIRNLVEELVGHRVRIFVEDEEVTGRVGNVTNNLVILVDNDDVVFVDLADIAAVRVRE